MNNLKKELPTIIGLDEEKMKILKAKKKENKLANEIIEGKHDNNICI